MAMMGVIAMEQELWHGNDGSKVIVMEQELWHGYDGS